MCSGRFDDVAGRFGAVIADFEQRRIHESAELAVPRFTTRFGAELSPVLRALGLTALYEPGHLLGIAPDDSLVLDKAIHQTFLAMDEDGTEAAAATIMAATATAASTTPPVPVVLDRPFLFRLFDRRTGTTLFQGRILDPLA